MKPEAKQKAMQLKTSLCRMIEETSHLPYASDGRIMASANFMVDNVTTINSLCDDVLGEITPDVQKIYDEKVVYASALALAYETICKDFESAGRNLDNCVITVRGLAAKAEEIRAAMDLR